MLILIYSIFCYVITTIPLNLLYKLINTQQAVIVTWSVWSPNKYNDIIKYYFNSNVHSTCFFVGNYDLEQIALDLMVAHWIVNTSVPVLFFKGSSVSGYSVNWLIYIRTATITKVQYIPAGYIKKAWQIFLKAPLKKKIPFQSLPIHIHIQNNFASFSQFYIILQRLSAVRESVELLALLLMYCTTKYTVL